jgi:hypothetical protein
MSISGTVSASISRAGRLSRQWAPTKFGSTHLLPGAPRRMYASRSAKGQLQQPLHAPSSLGTQLSRSRASRRATLFGAPPMSRLLVLGVAGVALLAAGCGDSIPAARATKATTPAPTIAWGISSALVIQSNPAAILSVPAASPHPTVSVAHLRKSEISPNP